MRLVGRSLAAALALAGMTMAPHAVFAGKTGMIVLSGVVGPNLAAHSVAPMTSGDGAAIAIGCNFTGPIHVSLEGGRFEPSPGGTAGAPADRGSRYVVTWRSPAPQEYSCQRFGPEVIVPVARGISGESVTTAISIN